MGCWTFAVSVVHMGVTFVWGQVVVLSTILLI